MKVIQLTDEDYSEMIDALHDMDNMSAWSGSELIKTIESSTRDISVDPGARLGLVQWIDVANLDKREIHRTSDDI